MPLPTAAHDACCSLRCWLHNQVRCRRTGLQGLRGTPFGEETAALRTRCCGPSCGFPACPWLSARPGGIPEGTGSAWKCDAKYCVSLAPSFPEPFLAVTLSILCVCVRANVLIPIMLRLRGSAALCSYQYCK